MLLFILSPYFIDLDGLLKNDTYEKNIKMSCIKISSYGSIRIVSFHPLCKNIIGLKAIEKFGLPPFIDGSCRREPDFENPFPSISALCRQGQFAPHLKVNDIIVYITIKGNYSPFNESHNRLVGILQVKEIYGSHKQGYVEYLNLGLPIPSNCMIDGNPPFSFDKTAGKFKKVKDMKRYLGKDFNKRMKIGKKKVQSWDSQYKSKSKTWPCFIRTAPLYVNLNTPPPIYSEDIFSVFAKKIGTRNPKIIYMDQLKHLSERVGIKICLTERF